jgi:Flp pilus assembly protein TadD
MNAARTPSFPWRHLAVFGLMLAIAFCAYSNSFKVPFQFDDFSNISENRSIHFKNFSFDEVQELIKQNYKQSIRIFAYVTFALNHYFGGLNVFGYHLVNLLIHLSSGLFLYWFLLLTFNLPSLRERYGPKAFPIALFTGLLFVSHPIQTQSVTYIVQRMASMGGMFYILAMALYVRGRLFSGSRRYLCWAGLGLSYLLGLFTKENVAILPIFIALYEFYFFQNVTLSAKGKKTLTYVSGAVVLIGLLGILIWGSRYYNVILEGYKTRDFTLTERILTQFRVVLYYVTLLLYPAPSRLNLDYDFFTSRDLFYPWTTPVSVFIVGGLIGYSLYVARKRPVLSYFVLWYFGNLVIESSIFPLEMVYEHRLYLPLVGPVVLFVVGVLKGWEWLRKRWEIRNVGEKPLWTFFCCLILLFVVGSYQRNVVWRDEISLWEDVLAKSPNKSRPLCNLGVALSHVGRYNEAISLLTRAVSLKPDYVEAYNNLGAALIDAKRPDEAVTVLEKAISIKPDYPEAYYNLGRIYLLYHQDGNTAIHLFMKAIMLKPTYVDAYVNLGATYNRMGRFNETVRLLEEVKGLIADRADCHFNLGVAYAALGNTSAARRELEMLVEFDPRIAEQLRDFMTKSQRQ